MNPVRSAWLLPPPPCNAPCALIARLATDEACSNHISQNFAYPLLRSTGSARSALLAAVTVRLPKLTVQLWVPIFPGVGYTWDGTQ
jgi:hypothetical protein